MSDLDRLRGETFTTPVERLARVTALVRRLVPAGAPARLLDLGCGTGEQLLALAPVLPRATLVGLDISAPSIARARAAAAGRSLGTRVAFLVGDYLADVAGLREAPFDLILADTVLHAIPGPTSRLLARLAADLAPGGALVYTMPVAGGYNRALAGVRRGFRALQGPAMDAVVLAAARLVHGRGHGVESLRERIPYMYLVPTRYDGPAFHAEARAAGFTVAEHGAVPHASFAQMKHSYTVLRKARA